MRRRGSKAVVLVFVALLVAMVFALSGCKYSDVLTQHTEDPELGAVDETAEPVYQANPDAELVMDMAEMSIDESDDENTQVEALPHYDPAAPDNGPTKQRIKSPDTPHDEEASEGEESQEPADRSGDAEDEDTSDQGGDDTSSGSDDDDEGEDEGTGEELSDDEAEDPGDQSDESSGGGETVIVNPDGTDEETAKGSVAAVGEYATIAQMLGGAGALAACDQAWLDARSADGAFTGELDRVQVGFSGDGTEDGSCNVDALISTIKPSVLLWDSTANEPALTESEITQLQEAGITVQAVPHIGEQITEDYAVKAAVTEVASVLEGASGLGLNPSDVLTQYVEFHDNVLKSCYDSNGGYSYKIADSQFVSLYQNTPLTGLDTATTTRVVTVYVDDLRDFGSRAVVSQTYSTSTGVVRLPHDGQTLDISEGVGLSATSSTSAYMLLDYYLQLAGVTNNAYDGEKPDSQGRRYILMPGSTASFGTSGNFASRFTGTAFMYNAGDGTVAANWHVLGDSDFNTVLVANDDIAGAFVNSAAKDDGLYNMGNPYQVIVVPSGIAGPWTEGHIDSFLISPWAFRIQDADNLDAAEGFVSDFYKTYLRCSNWQDAVAHWDTAYTAG